MRLDAAIFRTFEGNEENIQAVRNQEKRKETRERCKDAQIDKRQLHTFFYKELLRNLYPLLKNPSLRK